MKWAVDMGWGCRHPQFRAGGVQLRELKVVMVGTWWGPAVVHRAPEAGPGLGSGAARVLAKGDPRDAEGTWGPGRRGGTSSHLQSLLCHVK